jgi:hypothetical protein
VGGVSESLLQQQLDEVRALLHQARELFGPQPVSLPDVIGPTVDPGSAN